MIELGGVRTSTERRGDVHPSLDELAAWLADRERPPARVPVYREVLADTETPVSAFIKTAGGGQGFILESVEGGQRLARYSFVGSNPRAVIEVRSGRATISQDGAEEVIDCDDPLDLLRDFLRPYRSDRPPGLPLPRFLGGLVGYLSYEAVCQFEPTVGRAYGLGLGLPDARFLLVDGLLVFDNLERTVKVVGHVEIGGDRPLAEAYAEAVDRIDARIRQLRRPLAPLPCGDRPPSMPIEERLRPNTTRPDFEAMVERVKEYILAGDVFQTVLSQRIDIETSVHPFTLYRALRAVNPSPYLFYLDMEDHQIIGASPELLVRVEDGVVTNHPIAGTRPRGVTPEADRQLEEDLLSDEKERAEHVMLVDLGRNDVGRVSRPGSVRVPRFMGIDRYSHVMHIVSHVEGDLADGKDCFDALRACFPAGTVSGAPKVRAMQIIAELERDARGPYAGAVGYFDFSGEMDTCIALRTMIARNGIVSLQAGGGIVADSTPAGEYHETLHKMRALERAITLAESVEREECFAPNGRDHAS